MAKGCSFALWDADCDEKETGELMLISDFLAAISSFLGQSGQTKYLWNLCDDFYLAMKIIYLKLYYDVIQKSI